MQSSSGTPKVANTTHQPECYSVGHGGRAQTLLQTRKAKYCAGFILPHLVDGMTLLDCGCGPGSITADLAELIPAGLVFGIDREEEAIQGAIAFSQQRRLDNIHFSIANVYQLPFFERTFDAVFAHSLLMHLSQPIEALKEIRRVLKPGGIAGIADPDFGARVWFPTSALMNHFQELYLRVLTSHGASLYYARTQRALLLEAGFSRTEAHSFSVGFGDLEATSMIAKSWEDYAASEHFRLAVARNNWTDENTLQEMCEEVRRWGGNPESFLGLLCCGTLGWP